MGINISRINSNSNSNYVSFGRKPNAKEMQIYTSSVNEGLKLLNKQIDVIIHNSAAPSSFGENTGIGSLFSRTTQTKLIPFLKAHGITGIQQEPNNLRKLGDPSPYAPESAAKNILTIPLEKLTTEKYGKILPEGIFKDIFNSVTDNGYVDYNKVNQDYDRALRIAYANFLKGHLLKSEFEEFKQQNPVIEKSAIFRILSNLNEGHWEKWKGIDKNLYAPKGKIQAQKANERIDEIKTKYKDEIDYFMFQQFLIDQENMVDMAVVEGTEAAGHIAAAVDSRLADSPVVAGSSRPVEGTGSSAGNIPRSAAVGTAVVAVAAVVAAVPPGLALASNVPRSMLEASYTTCLQIHVPQCQMTP